MDTYDIVLYITIAIFAGLIGYYLGKIRKHHTLEPIFQQSQYWRFRYYQTFEDYRDLEEETKWLEDWCPDKNDHP